MPPPDVPPGPFTFAEGLAAGLTKHELYSKNLGRPFHGIRSPTNDNGVLERATAFARTMRPNEYFSHSTAAAIWGIPLSRRLQSPHEPLHVTTLNCGRERRGRGVKGHRSVDPEVRAVVRQSLPVLDPATVWLNLAGTCDLDDLVAAADYLVQCPEVNDSRDPRPYCTLDVLALRTHQFMGRGKRDAAKALRLTRVGSDSPMESLLRLKIAEFGLPEPRLNQIIRSSSGQRIGRVDMVYLEWRVIVEYDGDQHRTDTYQYEKDIWRSEVFADESWRLLRIRAPQLLGDFTPTAIRLRRALIAGGWDGLSVRPIFRK